MIATVLVGPGKPKLVQIQRPPSSQSRDEGPTVANLAIPSTPVLAPAEVSAFSPYDTPCEAPRIDSCLSAAGLASIEDDLNSPVDLAPPPLAIPTRSKSSRANISMLNGCSHALQELNDPFGASPRRSRSFQTSRSFDPGWTVRGIPEMPKHRRELSPTTNVATWSRCRKMERVLNAVTTAMDTFPDCMLRLDSSAVLEIRCPHVADKTYIQALQKVFPAAPSLLLSALTACIIVDLYLSRLKDHHSEPMERYWAQAAASNESLHRIPHKAREMLGIGLPDSTSIRLNEYALKRRASAIHASVEVVGQKLIEALRGSWDDDIWRSLKVLVEVIEARPQPWD